jgi:hypothetical protein
MSGPASDSLITDAMRATIGVPDAPVRREVDRTAVRMFARAIGYKDRVFYDTAYARNKGYRDIIAPPGYLGTPVYEPGKPGYGLPVIPSHFKVVLNGGDAFEYYGVVTAGDVLEAQSTVTDMRERTSASVGRMVITTRETTYKRLSDGKIVAKSIGTGIYY